MGPDSQPRRVLSTTKGYGPLYRVVPNKGESHTVNGDHQLSLMWYTGYHSGKKFDVTVREFLTWPA